MAPTKQNGIARLAMNESTERLHLKKNQVFKTFSSSAYQESISICRCLKKLMKKSPYTHDGAVCYAICSEPHSSSKSTELHSPPIYQINQSLNQI